MRICCLCWLRKTEEKTSTPKLLSYKFKKDEFLLLKQPSTLSKNFTTTEHKSQYKSPSCASSCNFNFKSVSNFFMMLKVNLTKQSAAAGLEAVFQVLIPGDSSSSPGAGSISNYCLTQEISTPTPVDCGPSISLKQCFGQ